MTESRQKDKVALFIDGVNLYVTAKALGFEIDYRKLINHFRNTAHLVRAYYYTALAEDEEVSSLRRLIDWLDYNGYMVVTKPIKRFTDETSRSKIKRNMSVELSIDALRLAPGLDQIFLFVGDGDYRILVAALQEQGARVSVVSTLESQPAMVADELRRQADNFIDLADLEEAVSRIERQSTPNAAIPDEDER